MHYHHHHFFTLSISILSHQYFVSEVLSSFILHRHGEPWGAGPGGAWLQDALPNGVPWITAWAHAHVLEERTWGATHFWIPARLPGGLLHLYGATVPARGKPVKKIQYSGFTGFHLGAGERKEAFYRVLPKQSMSTKVTISLRIVFQSSA